MKIYFYFLCILVGLFYFSEYSFAQNYSDASSEYNWDCNMDRRDPEALREFAGFIFSMYVPGLKEVISEFSEFVYEYTRLSGEVDLTSGKGKIEKSEKSQIFSEFSDKEIEKEKKPLLLYWSIYIDGDLDSGAIGFETWKWHKSERIKISLASEVEKKFSEEPNINSFVNVIWIF